MHRKLQIRSLLLPIIRDLKIPGKLLNRLKMVCSKAEKFTSMGIVVKP